MAYSVFEYVDRTGARPFSEWRDGLDSQQRARLANKINILRTGGPDLSSGLLAGTSSGLIRKLKVQGNVKLRPRLCSGPIHSGSEFSLLVGAVERDWKTVPGNADDLAVQRRAEIVDEPKDRRWPYGD